MNATPPHIARVPRIAITPGEPAGIGPDLCVTLAQRAHGAELVAVADPVLLMQRAAELHLPLALLPFDRAQAPQPQAAGALRVAPVPLCAPTRAGVLDAANAAYVLDTLRRGDGVSDIAKRQVSGRERDAQPLGEQHHHHLRRMREVREKFGVA